MLRGGGKYVGHELKMAFRCLRPWYANCRQAQSKIEYSWRSWAVNPLDGALSTMAEHRSSLISCSLNSRYVPECNFNSAPRLLRMGRREQLTPLIYWMSPSEACTAKKEAIESRWLINVHVNNISMAFWANSHRDFERIFSWIPMFVYCTKKIHA